MELFGVATAKIRRAMRGDVPGIQRVRRSVTENRLTTSVVTDDDVIEAIERTGRGWVVEDDGRIVGFALGHAGTGNIWALFVEPGHEGRGHGRRLHDEVVAWLWAQGLMRLWLTTGPATRAARFYVAAGWQLIGVQPGGELLFEMNAGDSQ
jgi:GNAT superfamily N-acetyltransferase